MASLSHPILKGVALMIGRYCIGFYLCVNRKLYYTFLQLKMANRQSCLNAGAKLGTPPRVGAERSADVRN